MFPKVWEIYGNLQTSKTLGKIFAKHKLIDSKRQPSNLEKLLCSSNFSANKPTKCGKTCFSCDYIIEAELFKFKNWQQPFILKSNFNCETPNFIYVIIASGCNIKNILDKPEDSLKRDSVFTDSTFNSLNMTKSKSKDIYAHLQREYLKFFLSSKCEKITKS